jgi:signal transduction histidine kinase
LTDVALVSSAALLVWSLLYGWMTRSLTKRAHLHAGFSKRLIEEAARILDLKKRVQFLAEELGRTFTLRRVLLVAAGEPPWRGEFGPGHDSGQSETSRQIEKAARERHFDVVCTGRPADSEMRRLVGSLGFNYLFPLWYEHRLAGLLFLDTSPRRFLDDNEDMLLGLSREISHSIETCRVIEEKIALERALARQEHLASLGRMAATIAHEIKNPLTSIKALAQLMREDPEVGERHGRDLAYMIDEADRLNRSVQQLLSFSPPLPERQQRVELTGLLEDMAQLLARQCAGERIRIEHEIEPQLRLERSDPEMVRQIFLNLVLNAIQASEPGGSVRLAAKRDFEGDAIISVSDYGPGIPAGIREKIFEPFFTTKQRGTGLGLAIVRKNVHDLRGEVQVTSPIAEGRGTRVEVTLPIE